jgi:alkanesulfonate monooxygenase SsuD/methylene tetrahydromethanopterin reductase-like flavin-dependent oxidoreductase (luciferase family)
MRTDRVRLGLLITAPARRRPWKLARETMTIDRLSGGRLVLPVGLGTPDDAGFGNVGEPTDARTRAELMDETLAILEGLWSGEPFAFEGRHYRFGPMTFRPVPVQRPRIPVWVVGAWPHERSMRRVLRWDGVVTQTEQPDEIAAIAAYVARERPRVIGERGPHPHGHPFEIVVQGSTRADDPSGASAAVEPFMRAGATWWIDADWEAATVDTVRRRIGAGPPRTG